MSAPPVFQSAPLAIKYRAFISYAHADTRETRWLHKQLEAFKIDRDLVGRPTPGGPIPKSLRPIFRDRDDFTAGHTLSGQTLAALDASAALIVICSPACAKSHYVNEEIRLFKQHHPDRPVIPVIIAGRPASSPLPVPLRGEGRDSGARSVTGVEGEGQQQAKVALWATPHALPAAAPHPDPLPMPEQSMGIGDDIECFPPALRFLLDANGAITDRPGEVLAADIRDDGDGRALAVAKVVASLIGVSTDEVRKRQEIAWRRTTTIASLITLGVAILALTSGFFYWSAQEAARREAMTREEQKKSNAAHEAQLAEMKTLVQSLLSVSKAQAAPGAERAVGEAVAAAAKGAGEGDARLAKALDLLKAGKPSEAEPLFRAVAEDKAARVTQDKTDAAAAYRNLGAIAGLGDPKRARDAFEKALALAPDDLEALYWYGRLNLLAGNLPAADTSLSHLLKVATVQNDQRGIYRANLRLGEVVVERGDLKAARRHQDAAMAIAEAQTKANSGDLEWQRDLSVSHNKIGDVLVAQGDLPGALESYRADLAIAERLAKSDPGNAGWQRDLSVSHEKIGDVQVAQGNLPGALESYRASLAIRDRLAKSDAGNAGWQRDLSVSHDRMGDVQVAQGDLPGALESYRASQGIAERLAKSDPGNAGWQRDLAISYLKIALTLDKQGNRTEALADFRQGQAIMIRLVKLSPDNTTWKSDAAFFAARIAALEGK